MSLNASSSLEELRGALRRASEKLYVKNASPESVEVIVKERQVTVAKIMAIVSDRNQTLGNKARVAGVHGQDLVDMFKKKGIIFRAAED